MQVALRRTNHIQNDAIATAATTIIKHSWSAWASYDQVDGHSVQFCRTGGKRCLASRTSIVDPEDVELFITRASELSDQAVGMLSRKTSVHKW